MISNHIVNSGKWFPQTVEGGTESEPNYSGGMVFDPENPSIVYLSKQVNGIFEIFKYTTTDNGAIWETEAITANSPDDVINVRPVIPRGHKPGSFDVMWLRGKYVTYANFLTSVMYYSPNELNTKLDSITINGIKLDNFDPEVKSYRIEMAENETEVPHVKGHSSVPFSRVEVEQAKTVPGKALIKVHSEGNSSTATYEVLFGDYNDTSANKVQIGRKFLYPTLLMI